MLKPFGETLHRLRMEKGLSQQQLAKRLHVERSSFSNREAQKAGSSSAIRFSPDRFSSCPPFFSNLYFYFYVGLECHFTAVFQKDLTPMSLSGCPPFTVPSNTFLPALPLPSPTYYTLSRPCGSYLKKLLPVPCRFRSYPVPCPVPCHIQYPFRMQS